jgi:hypothetical protein
MSVFFKSLWNEVIADQALVEDIPAGASRERVVARHDWVEVD